jgi:hypothetical protein
MISFERRLLESAIYAIASGAFSFSRHPGECRASRFRRFHQAVRLDHSPRGVPE